MRRKAIRWVEESEWVDHRRTLRWPGVLLGAAAALGWVGAVWGLLSLVAYLFYGLRP